MKLSATTLRSRMTVTTDLLAVFLIANMIQRRSTSNVALRPEEPSGHARLNKVQLSRREQQFAGQCGIYTDIVLTDTAKLTVIDCG